MFPSSDQQFPSVTEFLNSLTDDQRCFFLAFELHREQRLQSALKAASGSLSGLSELLADSIHIRLGRAEAQ